MAPLDFPPVSACASLPDEHEHRFFFLTARSGSLSLGEIDDVRSVHSTRIPLSHNLLALAVQPASQSLLLLLSHTPSAQTVAQIQLCDCRSYAALHSFILKLAEVPFCVASGPVFPLSSQPQSDEFFVVGTAFVLPKENEPSQGRLLVLRARRRRLELVAEAMLSGGCLSICLLKGKIVCGVNSEVQVWSLDESTASLTKLASEVARISVISLSPNEEDGTIAVGDTERSVSVYRLGLEVIRGRQLAQLELIASEERQRYVTTLERLPESPSRMVVGDMNGNLSVMQVEDETDLDRSNPQKRVVLKESFHLDDQINRFVPVSLFRTGAEDASKEKSAASSEVVFNLAFATVNGRIGMIGALNDREFRLLRAIERAMESVWQRFAVLIVGHHAGGQSGPPAMALLVHIVRSEERFLLHRRRSGGDGSGTGRGIPAHRGRGGVRRALHAVFLPAALRIPAGHPIQTFPSLFNKQPKPPIQRTQSSSDLP